MQFYAQFHRTTIHDVKVVSFVPILDWVLHANGFVPLVPIGSEDNKPHELNQAVAFGINDRTPYLRYGVMVAMYDERTIGKAVQDAFDWVLENEVEKREVYLYPYCIPHK